jgi:ubiquinone/menaquinone biosynthesis C-methylase UbiE
MGRETSPENDAAIRLLAPPHDARVLEVGCGHGRTLRKLSHLVTAGLVAGLDGSRTMLRVARRANADAIARGRAWLVRGDSARIPCRAGAFDRALAVHTLYFWTDPRAHLREIRRVLRDGGRLVLCFRARADALRARRYSPAVYRFYEAREVEALLGEVGFGNVGVREGTLQGRQMVWVVADACASTTAPRAAQDP